MIKARECTRSLLSISATPGGSKNNDTIPVQGSDAPNQSKKDNNESCQGSASPEGPEHGKDAGSEKYERTNENPEKANVSTLPNDFDPYQYFKERRKALLNDPTVAVAVEKIRNNPTEFEQVNTTFAGWLRDQEVSLSIAAVTLGITAAQDLDGGFASLNQDAVQQSMIDANQIIAPTIRPGRPLMVPLNWRQHFVLVVIQFGGSGETLAPTISILDSKSHHHAKPAREVIFTTARNMLINSRWDQHPNFPWDDKRRLYTKEPLYANWVPVAVQPTDTECGYYAILNAWALALALQPNVDFFLRWTDEFFQDLIDVIHIVRVGQADWKLIYAFLRCKQFVKNAVVPPDRRFDQTANLPDGAALDSLLTRLREAEQLDQAGRSTDIEQLAHANRTDILEGRRHNTTWPSDSWTRRVRDNFVKDLERWGELNLSDTSTEVKQRWNDNAYKDGEIFEPWLEEIHGDLKVRTLDMVKDILPRYRKFLNQLHPSGLNKHLDLDPCAWIKDAMNLYECILDNEPLQRSFSQEIRGEVDYQECQPWEANIAIAAVVEAIDDKQRELYKTNNPDDSQPFAGGFSMAPSAALSEALLEEPTVGHDIASRPRKCWFIPLNVSGKLLDRANKWRTDNGKRFTPPEEGQSQGHTLLVVLQERQVQSETGKLQIDMFFLDSSPDILGTTYVYLISVVKDAAKRLGWASHRNTATLRAVSRVYPVPAQQDGGYQCGYHAFVNACILAMGLKPDNTRGEYSEEIYEEAWKLARAAIAGLLDWKALVAWFFCRKLTEERSFEAVPSNRRFETTVPQVPDTLGTQEALGDGELRVHARQRYDLDDRPLESLSIAKAPYDLSNNVAPPPPKATKQEDESKGLKRSHDDADLDFLNRRAGTKRKSREKVDDGLDFLSGSHMESDIEVIDSVHPTLSRKRQRLGDGLSFLNTY